VAGHILDWVAARRSRSTTRSSSRPSRLRRVR
jgi:hypothetical protein